MKVYRWQEQESLQNLYKTEVAVLQNGLGGDFELVEILPASTLVGVVAAMGYLKYRGDDRQGILVVFPTKYPYNPPKIIAGTITSANGKNAFAQYHFGKGNQYSDGELCLIDKSKWDSNIHNVGWALRHAQKWLRSATSKDGFLPDEIVEEIPIHFQHVGQVLIPRDFPVSGDTGELLLTQFRQNHYILAANVIPEIPFRINLGNEVFKRYVFPNGVTLKDVLPASTAEHFINLFKQYFSENILAGGPTKNVAFYFPGDSMKWHFFKLQLIPIGNQISLNVNYFISRNISNELYLRTEDIFSYQILRAKKVTVIGLGALGSEIALSLANNGIGTFHLFDKEVFEIGNSVRHTADLYYVGESKVEAVKQQILRSDPNIIVNAKTIDVLVDNGLLEQALNDSDLVIVMTGEDNVDYMINDIYHKRLSIPFIFAGVSIGGYSGSIQVVDKESACLRCLATRGLDTLPSPKGLKGHLRSLPPEYGSCSSPALPGSGIDLKEVSLQVSRISLQILLGDDLQHYPKRKGSQYRWHGPTGSRDRKEFDWEITSHTKSKNCEYCD